MPNIHLRNNYQKAVVCMVLAYISIALMGVFVKYASDELPSSEILFSRFFIGFVFLLPFLIKDGDFKVDMSQWKFLILRNLAGIASMLLTFYAIKYLPISIAILLMNTSALFVPLLLFFFKVRTPLKVLACSFMGFIGVSIIMLTNGSMNINPIHVGYALGAAVLAAMAFISLQELNKHNSPKNIVFYFHLLGSIFLFFIALAKTDLWGNLSTIPSQPWWKLIGGVLGAVVVFTTVLLAPKLGITAMLFFIIVGQLITATTIDHFGLIGMPIREVNITKFIGLIIVAFGLVFYFFGDKLVELFGAR